MRSAIITFTSLEDLIEYKSIIRNPFLKGNALLCSLSGMLSNADIELAVSGFRAIVEIVQGEDRFLNNQLLHAI